MATPRHGSDRGGHPSPARELGQRVRARRVELGYSQEVLAERAGIHRTYVGTIERGNRSVGINLVVQVAWALQMDPADLVRNLGR